MANRSETTSARDEDTAPKPLNWGILGASRIARKLVPAMRAAGDRVIAVGASTLARAEPYARELEIGRVAASYAAIVEAPDIDAVYVPLNNDAHFRWALACARAGKHCLCEKPLVLSGDEARQLRQAFAASKTRLVEGFMWRHHPQTAWVLDRLRDGEIGDLVRIAGEFSFMLDRPHDYRWKDENGGGSLWDIGVYPVNAIRLFFGEEPLAVSARIVPAPGARVADASAAGWLAFEHGRIGTFQSSFVCAFKQSLTLVGTRGTIGIDRPFLGKPDLPMRCTLEAAGRCSERTFPPEDSYRHMIAHFRRAAADPHYALTPAEDGLGQTIVMEALAASAANGGDKRVLAG